MKNDWLTLAAPALAVPYQYRKPRIPCGTQRCQRTLRVVENAVRFACLPKIHDGPVIVPLDGLIDDEFQLFHACSVMMRSTI